MLTSNIWQSGGEAYPQRFKDRERAQRGFYNTIVNDHDIILFQEFHSERPEFKLASTVLNATHQIISSGASEDLSESLSV